VVTGGEHVADRPSWDCRSCGKPWPCDPARENLLATMDSLSLAMLAWLQLEAAAGDLPQIAPAELYERFLRWTRRPRSGRASSG
jgi:hypothetical protein